MTFMLFLSLIGCTAGTVLAVYGLRQLVLNIMKADKTGVTLYSIGFVVGLLAIIFSVVGGLLILTK